MASESEYFEVGVQKDREWWLFVGGFSREDARDAKAAEIGTVSDDAEDLECGDECIVKSQVFDALQ